MRLDLLIDSKLRELVDRYFPDLESDYVVADKGTAKQTLDSLVKDWTKDFKERPEPTREALNPWIENWFNADGAGRFVTDGHTSPSITAPVSTRRAGPRCSR